MTMTTPPATILIVDDEIQNRKLLEAMLRPEGYLTLSAADGEQALALIAERAFDERRQEGLRVAGHLHDIGKVTIPSEILSKPGRLISAIEFQIVQEHAQASNVVLKGVEFRWPKSSVDAERRTTRMPQLPACDRFCGN